MTVTSYLNTYLGVSDVVYMGCLDGSGFDAASILNGAGLTGKSGAWTFNQGSTIYEIVGIEMNGGSHGARRMPLCESV